MKPAPPVRSMLFGTYAPATSPSASILSPPPHTRAQRREIRFRANSPPTSEPKWKNEKPNRRKKHEPDCACSLSLSRSTGGAHALFQWVAVGQALPMGDMLVTSCSAFGRNLFSQRNQFHFLPEKKGNTLRSPRPPMAASLGDQRILIIGRRAILRCACFHRANSDDECCDDWMKQAQDLPGWGRHGG